MAEIGLRERKRIAVAHELAQAAFDLAIDRGLDGFTIDDVVDRAGYARRTFANHYSCKEEAVTAVALEQLRAGVASMPPQPAGTPLIGWVRALAKHQMSQGLFDLLRQLAVLAHRHPALEAHLSNVFLLIRREATALIQARVGGRAKPFAVSIVVAAAYGALTLILDGAVEQAVRRGPGDDTPGPQVLDAIFDQLESGF